MARRWLLSIVVAVVLVAVAVFSAHQIRGDESDNAARVTSSSSSTTPSTTTTASSTTTPPPPTTGATSTSTTGPPGPCGGDAGPIQTAVFAAVNGASANAQVASCRLAASDSSWGAVQLTAKSGAQFTAVTVIVRGGAGSWSVVAQGGTSAGCGQAPQQVIVDLGQFCAGSGGNTQ